ncbi:hypothetical protein BJF90_02665 [Pseudonocardia sp. CNS-004]|nr:hypothetical protein BJF90_02665 [Pseudonocardia sp. CNS-004]
MATARSSSAGSNRRTVGSGGLPWTVGSTSAGSSPCSIDQVVQARSTDASESTNVPSMSSRTARTDLVSMSTSTPD